MPYLLFPMIPTDWQAHWHSACTVGGWFSLPGFISLRSRGGLTHRRIVLQQFAARFRQIALTAIDESLLRRSPLCLPG